MSDKKNSLNRWWTFISNNGPDDRDPNTRSKMRCDVCKNEFNEVHIFCGSDEEYIKLQDWPRPRPCHIVQTCEMCMDVVEKKLLESA